jgi:protein-tyrosine phosphatase
VRICFVCMGNICRSPTAEGVMRKLAREAGIESLVLDSAGTGGWHAGEPPDPRSIAAARRRGYELDHRARQFVAADCDRFDLVAVMDRENLAVVRRLADIWCNQDPRGERERPSIRLLRTFDPDAPKQAEVPDPYGGSEADFDLVVEICERACRGLVDHLRSVG